MAQEFFNERLIVIEIDIGDCRGIDLGRCLAPVPIGNYDRRLQKLLFWLAVLGTISG
jgi:hypothetical protein